MKNFPMIQKTPKPDLSENLVWKKHQGSSKSSSQGKGENKNLEKKSNENDHENLFPMILKLTNPKISNSKPSGKKPILVDEESNDNDHEISSQPISVSEQMGKKKKFPRFPQEILISEGNGEKS